MKYVTVSEFKNLGEDFHGFFDVFALFTVSELNSDSSASKPVGQKGHFSETKSCIENDFLGLKKILRVILVVRNRGV